MPPDHRMRRPGLAIHSEDSCRARVQPVRGCRIDRESGIVDQSIHNHDPGEPLVFSAGDPNDLAAIRGQVVPGNWTSPSLADSVRSWMVVARVVSWARSRVPRLSQDGMLSQIRASKPFYQKTSSPIGVMPSVMRVSRGNVAGNQWASCINRPTSGSRYQIDLASTVGFCAFAAKKTMIANRFKIDLRIHAIKCQLSRDQQR